MPTIALSRSAWTTVQTLTLLARVALATAAGDPHHGFLSGLGL
jgi:hypothetical protein